MDLKWKKVQAWTLNGMDILAVKWFPMAKLSWLLLVEETNSDTWNQSKFLIQVLEEAGSLVRLTILSILATCLTFTMIIWLLGPSLPFSLYGSTMVTSADGHGVIVMGGYNDSSGEDSNEMFELKDINFGHWALLPQKLHYARVNHLAIPLNTTWISLISKSISN